MQSNDALAVSVPLASLGGVGVSTVANAWSLSLTRGEKYGFCFA